MKLIKQISTGRTVHREVPHGDNSINNAAHFTGISLQDLQVADDNITEEQYDTRLNDELLPLDKIARLEATVTQRRIREMTTDAGKKWMEDLEAKIATERSKL